MDITKELLTEWDAPPERVHDQCLNDEFNLYPFARPDKYKYSFAPLEEEV